MDVQKTTNSCISSQVYEFWNSVWKFRPIQENHGGMGFCHSFWVWHTIRKLNPRVIIESGVWRGHSTWLLEVASDPMAKIICLDPLPLTNLMYHSASPRVTYYVGDKFKDFAQMPWETIIKKNNVPNTLCFFDDHYGKDRLFQAAKFGFKHMMFDDNYAMFGGNQFNPRGNDYAPKAALALPSTSELRKQLDTMIEVYDEMPPLLANTTDPTRNAWDDIKSFTQSPIFTKFDDVDEKLLQDMQHDAQNYTWICYILLKISEK